MQKVYDVEIDLDMLRAAERRQAGFGAIRAVRQPLPMCQAEVEQTYALAVRATGCVNPEFGELPVGEPTFRVFAQIRSSAERAASLAPAARTDRATSQTESAEQHERAAPSASA